MVSIIGIKFSVEEINLGRIIFPRVLIDQQHWIVTRPTKNNTRIGYGVPQFDSGRTVAILTPYSTAEYKRLQDSGISSGAVIIDDHSPAGTVMAGTGPGRITLRTWGACDPIPPEEVEAWFIDGKIKILCPRGLKIRGSSAFAPLPQKGTVDGPSSDDWAAKRDYEFQRLLTLGYTRSEAAREARVRVPKP